MRRFAVTVFAGAFLLFLIEPLIGKVVLPWFGGTPSVWTTCMLFFQVLLLAAYAYAHALAQWLRPAAQARVHAALLVGSVLLLAALASRWPSPVTPAASWKPRGADAPELGLLLILGASVGLPFFVLGTTGPLLQSWFARTRRGPSPYRLYALSNAGSLLALVAYPFVLEPLLPLRAQGWVWAAGYLAFVAAGLACARAASTAASTPTATATVTPTPTATATPTRWAHVAAWVVLPALASVLLLAASNQLCQEVAVVPFLWVLPLALYLLSFIAAFDSPRWYRRSVWLPLLAAGTGLSAYALVEGYALGLVAQVLIHSLALLCGCMVCHGEVAQLKPDPSRLTAYYLALAVGGALGGVLVGLVAPHVFRIHWELGLALVGTGIVGSVAALGLFDRPQHAARNRGAGGALPEPEDSRREAARFWTRRVTSVALLVAPLAVLAALDGSTVGSLKVARSFYGVLRFEELNRGHPEWHAYRLRHGTISHGVQFTSEALRHLPAAYYTEPSGVGRSIAAARRRAQAAGRGLRVGVLGLGVGTIAAYAGPDDRFRFYEINPDVVAAANGEGGLFTYLREARGPVEVVLGDARVSMERELEAGSQRYDVLAVDVFSSDAIPAHLMTREAFALYAAHLADDGLLAIHVSNRFLALDSVVTALARDAGLAIVQVRAEGAELRGMRSNWMVLARTPAALEEPELAEAATPAPAPAAQVWTDDFANLLGALHGS